MKPGDVVRLRSGGEWMTVESVSALNAQCHWWHVPTCSTNRSDVPQVCLVTFEQWKSEREHAGLAR